MNRSILIVDDEASIVFALSEYLRAAGFEVVATTDLEVALACLAATAFDAVIADFRLHAAADSRSGLDLLAGVRRDHPRTLTVLTSASADVDLQMRAGAAGIAHLLEKPFPLADLALVLKAGECAAPVPSQYGVWTPRPGSGPTH